jgi:transketolase
MVSMAAAMASQGLTVICYSIAPFVVFRPAEQIRLDVCLHNKDVKIVGNGGGYGYGIMGATHHAIEDIAGLSSYQNMRCYVPFCNEDVAAVTEHMMRNRGPAYLRLGFGAKPAGLQLDGYSAVQKVTGGSKVTVAALGPVTLNVINGIDKNLPVGTADVFAVREMPLREGTEELFKSVKKTRRLLIAEEHVSRGGLGEHLALLLAKQRINCSLSHRCAAGYPDGKYGSQNFHQRQSALDADSLAQAIKDLING